MTGETGTQALSSNSETSQSSADCRLSTMKVEERPANVAERAGAGRLSATVVN
jgi:hypothetical protein